MTEMSDLCYLRKPRMTLLYELNRRLFLPQQFRFAQMKVSLYITSHHCVTLFARVQKTCSIKQFAVFASFHRYFTYFVQTRLLTFFPTILQVR